MRLLKKQEGFQMNLLLAINVLLIIGLLILSFVGIWRIMDGRGTPAVWMSVTLCAMALVYNVANLMTFLAQ